LEDDSFGRLVNDDHVHPTSRMKRILVGGKPHLCLFAARDINRVEEITYDYGDSSWPWREKVCQ
jgi:SET domain-containing protein